MRKLERPKKNRETNTDDRISQLIEAVTDTYLNPPENTADENGRMYLNLLAEDHQVPAVFRYRPGSHRPKLRLQLKRGVLQGPGPGRP